jgi:carboxyl-terminal processing protease
MKFFGFSAFIFLGTFFLSAQELMPLGPDDNAAHITRTLVRVVPQAHMNREPFTEPIARRTLDNYLRALDFDRSIFRASDIAEFRSKGLSLREDLMEGRLDLAFSVFERFKERAENRVAFVRAFLDEGVDAELDQEFVWRRRDMPWVDTEEEWDELWRHKITNEYIGHRVSQMLRELEAEEAAENEEASAEKEASDVASEADSEVEEERSLVAPQLDLSPVERILRRYNQFIDVLRGHDAEYVQQMFLTSFTRAYDTHSSYMSPRANEDFDINMRLSLTGIGAMLGYEDGAAKIERLIKGGPAHRDGRLQPGDRIIAVGQGEDTPEDILFWPLYRSVRLIRGEIGSTVVLHVVPASDPTGTEVRVIDLVRDEIKLEENAANMKIHALEREGRTFRLGILLLPDFYRDFQGDRSSASDVKALLEELNLEAVDGLVFDLRNNGGGSLQDAVEMSGFFIDSGPIVQVRSEGNVRVLSDPRRGVIFNKPLVILVNRQSASASEILAAALQDYGRAVIVGDSKTHGKGSVQSIMPLDRRDSGLGSLKVTTAAFYRIDGRSTQLKGVSPDIEIRSPSDVLELGEEFLENVLPWTWVAPVRFRPHGSLRAFNEQLRETSAARMAGDEEFVHFQQKIDRLEERARRRQVSLNLTARKEQALADRELDRLQEDGMVLEDEEDGNETESRNQIRPERDIVLREGLQILADLVELMEPN